MRVRISTNPPLPPVKAWFPLTFPSGHGHASAPTISSFKSVLCTSLPAFRGVEPSSLHLTIDGFELLDGCELTVLRDGDLICVDRFEVTAQHHPEQTTNQSIPRVTKKLVRSVPSYKRKRRESSRSESSSETESTTSESSSESSDSESTDSEDSSAPSRPSLRKVEHHAREHAEIGPSAQPKLSTFVPPGCGTSQTRGRNLRRRLKRIRTREAVNGSEGGPVSGANAVVPGRVAEIAPIVTNDTPTLLSLSLRNKNKAKNFRSLVNKPLPPKIIFGDQEEDVAASGETTPGSLRKPQGASMPRLIPPSSRSSLPPNMFVTSVDVEADLHREKKRQKKRIEHESHDVDKLESIANEQWDRLEKPTREKQMVAGMVVGYKALGINPMTYTPEECLSLVRVVSCDEKAVVVRLLGGREEASFSGPVEVEEEAEEEYTWDEILDGDWRIVSVLR